MADEFGEKTEAPTPRRKQKAAEEGQLLRSRDFGAALVVMAGCGWMALLGPSLMGACRQVMAASFSFGREDIEHFEPFRPLAEAGWKLAPAMGMLFLVTIGASIAGAAALGSFGWHGKAIQPKGSRINPASGLKRIFGPTGWIELGKSLLKVILLGAIGWWMLSSASRQTMGLVSSDLHAAIGGMGSQFITLMFAMAGGMLLIAGIDVPIQIFRHLSQLRMTKQEVKEEHKETEGSPEMKSQQRQRAHELSKGGMRKGVQSAQVVITNPTHFAVALRYEDGDTVPVVVAKGRGATALAIRELAAEFSVPVLEYPALARAVYYTSREGQEIRDDLYLAVATVLAFVFRLNQQAGGYRPDGIPSAGPMPAVAVPDSALFDENGQKMAGAG
ncbi:flagellar biosynthesis protein FlhB [Sphingomonas canadensis]|uniref:Flagellar biosynthesis protein FlhB n=1 Tax=Sphingomonas canadensis TaxID=1219257 RepID=A0ABW3H6N3_9SPHN|nr:flagellar type III secretion system protein FlhB [Sphingomonas canadensis]MCW3834814.1 flagellar type III secretion system protein FlhB [Sphingomonas canadensis]